MAKYFTVCGKETVKDALISIGQDLINRADKITDDLENVISITINAEIVSGEIVNYNVNKNYGVDLIKKDNTEN